MISVDQERLLNEGYLQATLENFFARSEHKRVLVGYRVGERVAFASVGDGSAALNASDDVFHTGCITKLFTAALVAAAVRARQIDLDKPAHSYFGRASRADATLAGATVRHLLEHTHGIDDSACNAVPLQTDGFVNVEELLGSVAGQRIAPPGRLYSYSHYGARLLAGILEQLNGVPYLELLRRSLFGPLGLHVHEVPVTHFQSPDHVCPAAGGTLAISVADALAFLAWATREGNCWPVDSIESQVTPLPGWSPLEVGVYRGWKYYGSGWLGHHSLLPQESALVRASPTSDTWLVIFSRDHPATLVAARLFSAILPEYRNLTTPRPLSKEKNCTSGDMHLVCGCYSSAAKKVTIESNDGLRLTVGDQSASLVPAANNMFYTRPALCGEFAFVQLLEKNASGFRYLWNGRRIFVRS